MMRSARPRGILRRTRVALAVLAPILVAGRVGTTRACDACVEDKIAATYDWRVVSTAARTGHTVVFLALRGAVAPGDTGLARAVARRLAALRAIDPGTVRVSLAPPAASFACGPASGPPERLIGAANRALARRGVALSIVRVGAPAGSPPPRGAATARH